MQHVDNFLRMLKMMNMRPKPANPIVKFLATGMMGDSWAEHVCLEMAAGEGFVLLAFYAMIDTLDHQPSVDILKRAVKQEERHVDFGERATIKAIEGRPGLRRRLLGLNLVSIFAIGQLARAMQRRMDSEHPLLSQLPQFLEHANRCAELRLQRLGLLDRPLAELGLLSRGLRVAEAYGVKAPSAIAGLAKAPFKLLGRPFRRQKLTSTYLDDSYIRDFELPTRGKTPESEIA